MASQSARYIAEQLVMQETSFSDSQPKVKFSFTACEKLRRLLSSLLGKTQFRALLSRALALTRPELPTVGPVKVNTEGRLEGVVELLPGLTPKDVIEAETALVSHMVDLLFVFLGEPLTIRLLQDVLPSHILVRATSGKQHNLRRQSDHPESANRSL